MPWDPVTHARVTDGEQRKRDLPLHTFLLTEQYSDCGTSWKTQHQIAALPHEVHPESPAENERMMKKEGWKTKEKESKTNMRVQERVSQEYAWGKSSQSTLLTFIALTFTITAFKSTWPPCVCVCTCVFNVSEAWLHSELFPLKSITDEDTDKGHPLQYEQDINYATGWNDDTLLLMTFKLKQSIMIWSHSHINLFIKW